MAYKLKKGQTLHPFGPDSRIDEKNITDEIAEHILAKHPEEADKFEDNNQLKAWKEKQNKTEGGASNENA